MLTYLEFCWHRPFHNLISPKDKKINEVLFSSEISNGFFNDDDDDESTPKYLAWVGPRRADIVFPISATLTALARTLLSLFIFFSKSCDEEKNVDDNDDEKKPWGTTSHPHSRRSKERATKGLFLQPLWRRIYCRSQTEKRQNDPFCTFCSLQMATQVKVYP